jgi:putative pyruvate formate lyase activating enzyme
MSVQAANSVAAGGTQRFQRASCADRRSLALERIPEAHAHLAHCTLCAHNCGVDRLAGPAGFCHAPAIPRVFLNQIEVSNEAILGPVHAIGFSGCDLRCDFCISGEPSWNPRLGVPFNASELAQRSRHHLERGARYVMLLGGEPTIHLPAALELVSAMPDEALLIWKTNAHASAQARDWLDGLFDLWVADFKFGNDACAERLSRIPRYRARIEENLRWAASHSQLMIRHLLMPGHLDCCWKPVAQWIAREIPETPVSLMTGFWPGWQSHRHPEFSKLNTSTDTRRAQDFAAELGLTLVN